MNVSRALLLGVLSSGLALTGCGAASPNQAGQHVTTVSQASDNLAGTGLTACPGSTHLRHPSATALRRAITSKTFRIDTTATGLGRAVPSARQLRSATIATAASSDHASIYRHACGPRAVQASLTVTVCDAACRADESTADAVTTWWLNRGGHWYLWNAT